MKRGWWLLPAALIAVISLAVWGCPPSPPDEPASERIARDYLLHEATFKFDGMLDTLKLVATEMMDAPGSWEFVYQFTSRQSGYGDRTGQILLPVLTPHTARIIVIKGKVTSAIMDGRWDMMQQARLPRKEG